MALMTEPGGAVFVRLAVSLKAEDEQQLLELKHHVERRTGERLSTSKLVRMAIDCMRKAEGLGK